MIINGINYLARGSGFSGDSDSISAGGGRTVRFNGVLKNEMALARACAYLNGASMDNQDHACKAGVPLSAERL